MGIAQRLLTHVGNGVNVSMESWTTASDRGDGSGQVGTDLFVILMCINILFLFYVLYLLLFRIKGGRKVGEHH